MKRVEIALSGLLVSLLALPAPLLAAGKEGVHLRFATAKPNGQDTPVTVTVSGKISDAKSGEPIARALVRGHIVVWRYQGPDLFDRCPYQEVKSGADGTYKLTFVTPLTTSGPMKGKDGICVSAGASGYETKPEYVEPDVTADKTNYPNVNIALEPGKLVKGTVVDQSNRPIEGASVIIKQGMNGDWGFFASVGKTTTNQDGSFELRCSTDPQFVGKDPWLWIFKPGYGAGCFWDILKKDSMGTLILPRGGTIAGRVVDAKEQGIGGCEVSARDLFDTVVDKAVTDKEGKYELEGVPGEPSLIEFFRRKNGDYRKMWGEVTVYARPSPEMNLRDVPQYKIVAKDGKTVTGPDLAIGAGTSVSGKLVASKTTYVLRGLMVRLDYDWGHMVEADADGKFTFLYVEPGRHRLTAYLPTNLRGDRGIGSVEVDVQKGKPLEDVRIQLETLAEVRVQILDAKGNPLEGITAGATWTPGGEGFWTEGTRSDKDGRAVLYLYPGQAQYVRGFDQSDRSLVAEGFEKVTPKAGQVIDNVRVVMVPAATVQGRLMSQDGKALADQKLLCRMTYADKTEARQLVQTDSAGRFKLTRLVPGIVSFRIETEGRGSAASPASPIEIKPGEDKDIGTLPLKKVPSYKVSGRLLPSPTFPKLEGFKIRVDLESWKPLASTDAEGRFVLPKVAAGKHRLTAYLPFNLRTDRGVGHVKIEVKGGDLDRVELQLETLATIHMQIEDESGKPLEGIAAAAWWTKDHSGVFTEGTKSDKQGKATLYLYPGELQYVGAHDWDNRWGLKAHKEMTLKPGEVVDDLHIVMVSR